MDLTLTKLGVNLTQVNYEPTKCQNCGDNSHCGTANWREERDYDGNYSLIKACDACRCKRCSNGKKVDKQ